MAEGFGLHSGELGGNDWRGAGRKNCLAGQTPGQEEELTLPLLAMVRRGGEGQLEKCITWPQE